MHARGEEWVYEAAGVTGHTHMWAGVSAGAIGPVGCILDIGDELAFAEDFQDPRGSLQTIEVEVFAGWRVHLSLSLGCYGLVSDYANGGGAVV